MKIERRGDRVEIRRNKRRGLKLKIMEIPELNGRACINCLLWKNTTGICGGEVELSDVEMNLDPCNKLGLGRRDYFVHED